MTGLDLTQFSIEQLKIQFDNLDKTAHGLVARLVEIRAEILRRDPRRHGGEADKFWTDLFE